MSSTDANRARGACLCGAVRFEIEFPTKWCAHCHCTLCRRAHGAAFVTWVGVEEPRFRITHGADHLRHYASSPEALRSFCTSCGSTLLFRSQRWPGEVHVVLANLLDPIDRRPEGNAFVDTHVDWVEVPRVTPAS
jgi:hypothetical protein